MITEISIKRTKDYGKFVFIEGNRKIYPSHLKKLICSINKRDLLKNRPMVVNENFEVIDGQHRLRAAEELGVSIYYVVLPFSTLKAVQRLNMNQKNWTLTDFVESWIKRGKSEYVRLVNFSKEFSIPVGVAASLLDSMSNDRGHIYEIVKSGEFRVKNYDAAKKVVKLKIALRNYVESPACEDRAFIFALAFLIKDNLIDVSKFIKKFELYPTRIDRHGSEKLYLRCFEDIYNYRTHSHKKVRFF